MKSYFNNIVNSFVTLFTGLKITIINFFKPVVTVQYPHDTIPMTARYRGHIDLVKDENGMPKCVACGMCQKACPSSCIVVNGEKQEGAKAKVVTQFELDFTKCSLCGLCVETCPFAAIEFSKRYNLASTNKSDYKIDLIKRLEAKQ